MTEATDVNKICQKQEDKEAEEESVGKMSVRDRWNLRSNSQRGHKKENDNGLEE